MSDNLTEQDIERIANQAVEERLEEERTIGDKIIVSRREALALSAGSLGLGGLLTSSVGNARANANGPQGRTGSLEEPSQIFAWDIDMQGDMDARGNDISNVGSLGVGRVDISDVDVGATTVVSESLFGDGGIALLLQPTNDISSTSTPIINLSPGGFTPRQFDLQVFGQEDGSASTTFVDKVTGRVGLSVSSSSFDENDSPASRDYSFGGGGILELAMSAGTYNIVVKGSITRVAKP